MPNRGEREMQIGFIGLGTMGASMAANLQKAGYALIVHDARREAAARHIAAGAVWVEPPREIAGATEVMFTSLPGPPEVEAVALGPDGLLAGIREGAAYFDLSTNARSLVQKIHAAFAEKGAHMLDAPVSGGPHGAPTGKLALWIGGARTVLERYNTAVHASCDQVRSIRAIGAAARSRLVHKFTG